MKLTSFSEIVVSENNVRAEGMIGYDVVMWIVNELIE